MDALLALSGLGCGASVQHYDGVAVTSAPMAMTSHAAMVERSATAVAVIETDVTRGMGFAIDAGGYIITNRHVVEDASFVSSVTFPAHDPPLSFESVEVVYIDPLRDLALLRAHADEPLPYLPLGTPHALSGRSLRERDPVVVFAHEPKRDGELQAYGGRIEDLAHYNATAGPNAFLGFSVDVKHGQSGGPVLDRQGRAIGVVTWTWRDEVGGFAIPIGEAARMLAERPDLSDPNRSRARALVRTRAFLAALASGDVEEARRLTSPSHARRVREESMDQIFGSIDDEARSALRGFLAAVDGLRERESMQERQEELREIVTRTATPHFRDLMNIPAGLEDGRVVSFFFELGQSYLRSRLVLAKDEDAALEDAVRRLHSVEAGRTFALADAVDELAGRSIEIERVQVVPGAYSPRIVVVLRTSVAAGTSAGHRLSLHLRREWGDWYVAQVARTPLEGDGLEPSAGLAAASL